MTESLPLKEIAAVRARLAWMREARIWPNGLRYLWTDAFGVVLLVSLWEELHDERFLRDCECAPETSTTPTPSPMSWRARPVFRDGFSARSAQG